VLDDDGVSRRHARVRLMNTGNVELEDLNSTNGTYYMGERISRQMLKDGDKVQIGSTAVLKFSYQDQLEEALQKNLYESATRDGLTRLYNKKYFQEALDKEYAYAARHRVPLAVVMLDVDHFKKVNDTYGHPAGDYVLQKLSQVVLGVVRTEDIVARYGGEELALILRQSTEEAANRCAERIRSEVASCCCVSGSARSSHRTWCSSGALRSTNSLTRSSSSAPATAALNCPYRARTPLSLLSANTPSASARPYAFPARPSRSSS